MYSYVYVSMHCTVQKDIITKRSAEQTGTTCMYKRICTYALHKICPAVIAGLICFEMFWWVLKVMYVKHSRIVGGILFQMLLPALTDNTDCPSHNHITWQTIGGFESPIFQCPTSNDFHARKWRNTESDVQKNEARICFDIFCSEACSQLHLQFPEMMTVFLA